MRVAAYRLQRVGRWGRKSALLDATTTDISRLARIKINNLCPSHFNARNIRWIWLWILSCLPQRPPKDEEIQVFTAENLGRSRRRRWETDADVVEQVRNCTHFLPRYPIYGEFAEI